MSRKTMARESDAFSVGINLGEVIIGPLWTRFLPAINPQAAAKGSVTLSDIHANWQRDCDKQAYF